MGFSFQAWNICFIMWSIQIFICFIMWLFNKHPAVRILQANSIQCWPESNRCPRTQMIGGSSRVFSRMTSPHSILKLVKVTCFLSSSKHPGVGRSSGLPCCWPFLSASCHYLEGVKVEYSPAPTGKRKGHCMSLSYKDNEMILFSLNDLPVEIKGVCVWCGDKEENYRVSKT